MQPCVSSSTWQELGRPRYCDRPCPQGLEFAFVFEDFDPVFHKTVERLFCRSLTCNHVFVDTILHGKQQRRVRRFGQKSFTIAMESRKV